MPDLNGFTVWLRWTDTGDRPRYEVTIEDRRSQFGKTVEFESHIMAGIFLADVAKLLDIPYVVGYLPVFSDL